MVAIAVSRLEQQYNHIAAYCKWSTLLRHALSVCWNTFMQHSLENDDPSTKRYWTSRFASCSRAKIRHKEIFLGHHDTRTSRFCRARDQHGHSQSFDFLSSYFRDKIIELTASRNPHYGMVHTELTLTGLGLLSGGILAIIWSWEQRCRSQYYPEGCLSFGVST